ncbi:sigma-70 family RNA polymerase sigma factor [Leifsonia sp. LS-T14]|uniref:sigma-70 family RNA polymerase sigma factor n=1 Tax=unclassified Leifsonia TaxID=2663824 RepID=UPI0035A6147C
MTRELDDLSDSDLLLRARDGDLAAYGVLWKRHWPSACAMAAAITGRFEPDDLASEAFARILKAVEKGNGPSAGFRSYLATTVRNVAIDWSRRKSATNIEDPDAIEDWSYSEVTALDKIERETIAKAFYALPDSWQEVLWYTQVEGMAPRDVAPLLGITPNAVSAMTVRAREGLRQAWISAHLADLGPGDGAHAWTVCRLGAHARNKLSRVERRRVVEHLDTCESCSRAATEASNISSRLALSLLPLLLGAAGATAYAGWANSTTSAAAADAPVPPGSPRARVQELISTVGSSSHAGATAVAASVLVAAVLTTGTVLGALPDQGTRAPVTDAGPPPSGGRSAPDGSHSDDAPAPQAREQPATPPTRPTDPPAKRSRPPFAPSRDSGSALPIPPAARPGEPTATPSTPVTESVPRREAAVRSVPAGDTYAGYRLDDGDARSAVDFIHARPAEYDRSSGRAAWSLRDCTADVPTDVFSVQIWFRTTAGGGRLIGYSSGAQGLSTYYDRHLFLTDDGRLVFGVFPGAVHTVASTRGYADGDWHQATATLSLQGMSLYVDGERVAHDDAVVSAQDFDGYWRVGFDNLDSWGPDTPTQREFTGDLAYAAVYRVALTAEQIRAQWNLGK